MIGLKTIGIVLLIFALGFRPVLNYARASTHSPMDPALGQLDRLSPTQLSAAFANKRTLIVGGTRGVGRGIARTIAEAGGDITIVGRSATSGATALAHLKANAKNPTQKINFLAGDLGTARTSKALVKRLEEKAQTEGRFDYLVVTAAVFPDWDNLLNEDGLEKAHAIVVVGRYIVYRHMHLFMKDGGRMLNVLASGEQSASFDRELLTGERNVTNLIETLMNLGGSGELMLIGSQESGKFKNYICVTTHPGVLGTELHDGQGWLMDLLEPVLVAIVGISEEECGERQASILASPRLRKGKLWYADEDMIGRTCSTELHKLAEQHLAWLMSWLNERSEL